MTSKNCILCNNPIPNKAKKYCSRKCFFLSRKGQDYEGLKIGRQRSIENRKRIECKNCGGITTFRHNDGARKHHQRQGFCDKKCKLEYGYKEYKKVRNAGNPIIEINQDSIRCLICGKLMTAASTHFARQHGVKGGKELGHLDRQLAYGVSKGVRLVSLNHLEEQKEFGRANYDSDRLSEMRVKGRENNIKSRSKYKPLHRIVPQSDKQQKWANYVSQASKFYRAKTESKND